MVTIFSIKYNLCYFILIALFLINISATDVDVGMCAIVAATNVATKTDYTEWACSVSSITSTSPCLWTGVYCNSDDEVQQINLKSLGITGKC